MLVQSVGSLDQQVHGDRLYDNVIESRTSGPIAKDLFEIISPFLLRIPLDVG